MQLSPTSNFSAKAHAKKPCSPAPGTGKRRSKEERVASELRKSLEREVVKKAAYANSLVRSQLPTRLGEKTASTFMRLSELLAQEYLAELVRKLDEEIEELLPEAQTRTAGSIYLHLYSREIGLDQTVNFGGSDDPDDEQCPENQQRENCHVLSQFCPGALQDQMQELVAMLTQWEQPLEEDTRRTLLANLERLVTGFYPQATTGEIGKSLVANTISHSGTHVPLPTLGATHASGKAVSLPLPQPGHPIKTSLLLVTHKPEQASVRLNHEDCPKAMDAFLTLVGSVLLAVCEREGKPYYEGDPLELGNGLAHAVERDGPYRYRGTDWGSTARDDVKDVFHDNLEQLLEFACALAVSLAGLPQAHRAAGCALPKNAVKAVRLLLHPYARNRLALSAQVVSELEVIVRENFHRGAGTVNALIADHMAKLANQ